jgi:hypothetical protein
MLTRRKLLKVLIKSIFKDGWRSAEVISRNSDKISDETMSFDSGGVFYYIRLSLTKQQGDTE